MERVYVLEQALACAAEKFQLKFAEEAFDLLRAIPGIDLRPASKALLLAGVAEAALDPAIAVLRARYGRDLKVGGRRVRYMENPFMEPIMDVFVRVPSEDGDNVGRDLTRRGAVLRFKIMEKRGWLIRAEAPMAELLSYAADLSAMTGGRADHWITFNRWEPAELDGGHAA